MSACYTLLASRRPDDLGPCVAYLLTQTNLALIGLATVATLGSLVIVGLLGLRAVLGRGL